MKQQQRLQQRTIFLRKTTRLLAITILTLLFLTSMVATLLAYQTSTTTKTTTEVAEYTQTSTYTYLVNLKNNTLYDNPYLLPNQGEIFTQLITDIPTSITYAYQSNLPGKINGNYSVYAEIKTDFWTKAYPLTEQIPFTDANTTIRFTQHFSINLTYYNDILTQINTETEVTAPNPLLIIHTTIQLQQNTNQGTIHTQLTPEFTMTLAQKTVEISENLSNTQIGFLTKPIIITQDMVLLQRNLGLSLTLIFAIIFSLVTLLTKNSLEKEINPQKIIKKIYKKNGEWIRKTLTPPPTALQHVLRITSFDDLIKISEDLNKPLFHYTPPEPNRHIFYILDTATTYLYELNITQKRTDYKELK